MRPPTHSRSCPCLVQVLESGPPCHPAPALTSTDLYIDWGSFIGALVVIPLVAAGCALLIAVPLAAFRRLAWIGVPLAMLVAVLAGEMVFQATLDTAFARRSAARHWSDMERRARAEGDATDRDVCRRVLAQAPIPSPPAPPGAAAGQIAPSAAAPGGYGLSLYDRERCARLLGE